MKRPHFIVEAITFIAALLLLVEWLSPIADLAGIGYIGVFYVFVGLCFMLLLLRAPWWLSGFIKIGYMYWFTISVYTEHPLLSRDAINVFVKEWVFNLRLLFQQDLSQMTDPFRTLLFFILLWMTVYLIGYWIRMRATIFMFFLLSVVIIAILDTFTPFDGTQAIIRVFLIGLATSALLFILRLYDNQPSIRWRGLSFTALLLLVSVGLAILMPKAGPLWPDPVPYFYSTNPASGPGVGGEGGVNKVGYDEDDTRLGGSFIGDDTEVFQVTTSSRNYYRVETKDTYTTKGWIQSEPQMDFSYWLSGEMLPNEFPASAEEESTEMQIDLQSEFPFLFHTYGVERIGGANDAYDIRINDRSGKIEAVESDEVVALDEYALSFSEPSYILSELRSTSIEELQTLDPGFDRYLQLPEDLPQRVRDLSAEIVADEESVYDQAKSIEQYFRTNGFSYSQTNVAVPDADTDYVDQFLFDTKIGYCDNFSTSMVVLLRSAGIPARWVKGFTSGEVVETENGLQVFQVTNNNAHSWVEAYMPGIGWMNFEPTIGFTNTPDIEFDIELSPDDALAAEQQEQQQQEQEEQQEVQENNTSASAFSIEPLVEWLKDRKWWILGLFGIFALILGVAYRYRLKWLPAYLIWRFKNKPLNTTNYEKMYRILLRYLNQYGLPREEGHTLPRYARQIDAYFDGDHMTFLTQQYERILYGRQDVQDEQRLRESWEYLINRLSG